MDRNILGQHLVNSAGTELRNNKVDVAVNFMLTTIPIIMGILNS